MLNNKLSLASLAMLVAWGSLHAAEPAGRVLVLQGTAVAVRGAQEVPLVRGASVESGDLLRVGEGSSLQLRFTDESVVALRANTQFKIEDYKFTEKGEGDKSIFGLLKGGLRTITGLIGKRHPEAYQMRGPTATIGIRGTHFTVVNCAADCTNPDGSKAEDGLYGGVTDGRIVVRNSAGESEFSRDQYFVVPSPNSPARGLLAPPSFLRDKLDGMAKAGKGSQGKAVEASAGSTTAASTTTPSLAPSSPTTFATNTVQAYVPADTPVVQQAGTDTAGGHNLWNFALLESYTGRGQQFSAGVSSSSYYTYAWGEQIQLDPAAGGYYDYVAADEAGGYKTMADFLKAGYNFEPQTYNWVDGNGVTQTTTYSNSKTASVDLGYSAAAGNVSWGVYSEHGEDINSTGSSYIHDSIQHWAVGDPVTSPPTSGIYTYSPVGGTAPTDQHGSIGTITNRGQFTVNFGALTVGSTQPIAWNMPNGAAYSVSVPNQSFQTQVYAEQGYGTYSYVTGAGGGAISTQTSCTGCLSATTQVALQPFGAKAEGLGAALSTSATLSGGSLQNMSSIQIYAR